MSTDRKIFTGFAGGIGLSLINICVSFVQLRIFLHYLAPSVVGVWLIFVSIGSYVLFLDLGLSPTLGREISFIMGSLELPEVERIHRVRTLIKSCTRAVSGLALIVYFVGIFAGWAYIKSVTPTALRDEIHFAWLIFVAGASLNLIGEGWFAGIYGMGQIFTEKLIRSSGQLLGLTLMALSMALGYGVRALAVAWLLQAAITILSARLILGKFIHVSRSGERVDLSLIRRLIAPSLKYAATLLGGILILQTDNLVIASTLGTYSIPDYQAVSKLVTTLMSLSMMLVVTSTPFMSRAYAQDDIAEIRRLLERNQRFSLSVIIALGCIVACFADRIIALWLGPNHFVGFGVVWTLLAIMLFEAHHLAMATATMATGRIVFVWPALIAGVLNIGLSIYLARHLGVLGVALGTLVAQVCTNNWYVPFYSMRQFRISFRHHMRAVVLPVLLFLASMIGVAALMRYATANLPMLPGVLLGCLVIFLVSVAVFSVGILSSTERQAISSRIRSVLVS
jgi:O-antigen/teichoic acid export membrane protein